MARDNIEGGEMVSMEEKLNILRGKNIEGSEIVSKAEMPEEKVSKEGALNTPRGKNIEDSEAMSQAETSAQMVTKEDVLSFLRDQKRDCGKSGRMVSMEEKLNILRGKNIEGGEIVSKAETPAEKVTKEGVLNTLRGKNIEGGETLSEAKNSALTVTEEDLLKFLRDKKKDGGNSGEMVSMEEKLNIVRGKNIEGGDQIAIMAETPAEKVTKEGVLNALRGKNIEADEILRDAETSAQTVTEEDVLRFLREKKKGDATMQLYRTAMEERGRQKDKVDSTSHPQLFKAAMEGNWKIAKVIFDNDKKTKKTKISNLGMTALHVAASCGQSEFVVELVKILSKEKLEARDQEHRTALHHVALAANVRAAQAMVNKNPDLPHLGDMRKRTPLYYASKWRHPSDSKEMVDYLHQVTEDKEPCRPFTGNYAAGLVAAITSSGAYDTALRTLKKYPGLALKTDHEKMTILRVLAVQPSAFRNGYKLSIWESLTYKLVRVDMEETKQEHMNSPTAIPKSNNRRNAAVSFCIFLSKFNEGIRKVCEIKQSHLHALRLVDFVCNELQKEDFDFVQEYFIPHGNTAILHLATAHGVFPLVQECLNHFPDLIWYADTTTKRLLLHAAIEHRQVEIFNHMVTLIGKNTRAYAHLMDEKKNNCLHLAATLAPAPQLQSAPGPAFQMQRELQWFKAVEAIVYFDLRTRKNSKGQTPRELFMEEHKELLKDAKEWMKDTSNSCMVVTTLVATVAFAAMITVPGGNDSETGMPVLARKKLFAAFSIANALSMICSAISLLMFLSMQTSRNTDEDFLESLPKTLVRGLVFLSIAAITMMISFGMAIGLSLESRLNWAYIPITIVACFPAIIFIRLQLPLLLQAVIFRSGPGIFEGQKDGKLWFLGKFGYSLLANDMA